jgi:hypothetical protein
MTAQQARDQSSILIRWREHKDGRVKWHDLGNSAMKTWRERWNTTPVKLANLDVLPTVEGLHRFALSYLQNHTEADAVLVEYRTELRYGDPDQVPNQSARINLAWFADRLTAKQHVAEINATIEAEREKQ